MQNNILMPGDSAGNYDKKWTETFDLKFLILWIVLFLFLFSWTLVFDPSIFSAKHFFARTAVKLLIMMLLALFGGILCRHYCNTDEKGYITTSKNKWFKVNYTRKIQHFAAYLILVFIIFLMPETGANICFADKGVNAQTIDKSSIVKNKLFSITIPGELKGSYEVKKEKDKISVFHKDSKKAGFGGFAFGIKAYKYPADHAVLPGSRKIGELTDKKGILYDVVLKHPTDVQYDYTKNSKPPESYMFLYNLPEGGVNIKGVNGAVYHEAQGMKGKDLYKDVLQKHITAIKEKWDSIKLEQEHMSYMYNLTDKIGYIYYDVNGDGIDELLIGEIAESSWKGVIYDIYTMVDRKPKHVISGGSRDRYFVCNNGFICNEYSSGALESGMSVYNLVENSTELFPQVSFKYDGYTNPKKPWFLSYGNEIDKDSWENVTEEIFTERKKTFEKYERFDFIPINKF